MGCYNEGRGVGEGMTKERPGKDRQEGGGRMGRGSDRGRGGGVHCTWSTAPRVGGGGGDSPRPQPRLSYFLGSGGGGVVRNMVG